MSYGDRLREERERAGLGSRELSRAAGVGRSDAYYYESSRVPIVTRDAEALIDALGLSPADIIMDGPRLFEVEFKVSARGGPDDPEASRRVLDMVPINHRRRVSVWPWRGDGCVRVRARASSLPMLVGMSGQRVAGWTLSAPTVSPVTASPDLAVLVRASRSGEAKRLVQQQATPVDCCPAIEVQALGRIWLARLRGVPERCSLALQRLAPDSPIGMFVPA